MANSLRIFHFNDVYRVTPQKLPSGSISVTQFAHLLETLSSTNDATPLLLFSGDVFSPSIESTITRGSHMVPVLNALGLDVALTGFPHLTKLVKDCKFPWILSNIYDTETNTVPDTLQQFVLLERYGLKIGVIGLVEKEWIETVSSWPPNFKYKDMVEVGISLSKKLRDVEGPWACDIVDISLAKALYARPSSAGDVAFSHGVDLILGGHDHLYYASKGCQKWDGYDVEGSTPLGTEDDDGVLVIKSGTDFRDLSDLTLVLEDGPPGAVRRKLVKSVTGKRHTVTPNTGSSKGMENLLAKLLSSLSSKLGAPLCTTTTPLDVRSELIRTEESAAGNWFADVLLHSYDDALCIKGMGGADAVFICSGTLRGDSVYGPGVITLGDVLEILPFEDPIVVLELSSKVIWDALESSLSTWPAHEGRFPALSAFHVTWDSRMPPGQRVIDVSLERPSANTERRLEKVKRDSNQTYKIVTREYMAQGHDGFETFKGSTYLIDEEHGTLMSSLVRKYMLGSQYIHAWQQLPSDPPSGTHLRHETSGMLSRARARSNAGKRAVFSQFEVNKDAHKVAGCEHMQEVDCFDGDAVRCGIESQGATGNDTKGERALFEIRPEVDGRLKDIGRPPSM
ncbi:Metallo-dependent phosphatase [Ramaria rubella]|nr:Metallo-dependent phosphatase [Ramaria rubella]